MGLRDRLAVHTMPQNRADDHLDDPSATIETT